MEKQQLKERRKFLRHLMWGISLPAFAMLSHACSRSSKEGQKERDTMARFGGNCGDYSKLTEADFKARKQLGYQEKSPTDDTQCQECNLWLPPKENQTCGGCTLFSGPIEPEGTCTYWAPRQQG
jgi:High potential iron-sulfur protein.